MRAAVRAIALLGLAGLTVQAQSVPTYKTLTWTPALEFTDGTPFDESRISGYPLYCDGAFIIEIPNDFLRQYVVDVDLLGPGDHTCGITQRVDGLESILSNTVDFPLGQRTSKAPRLSVQ